MQALSSFLAQEPRDPLFAFVASPVSSAWKNVAVTCLTIFLLITPASLCVRFMQDSASALGHHDPRSHIPYYLAAAPLLLAASATAAHFLLKVKQLRTIAAVCAAMEWSGVTLSAFAVVVKLQVRESVPPPNHICETNAGPFSFIALDRGVCLLLCRHHRFLHRGHGR
jgi:hypothetical protein